MCGPGFFVSLSLKALLIPAKQGIL
ncbi:hypothetical protein [Thermoflexus sp.]